MTGPSPLDGLLWSELVAWWSEVTPGNNAANLGARLQEALASNAERKLFATYFKTYRVRPRRGIARAPAPGLPSLRSRCRQNIAPSPSASASAHGLPAPPARPPTHRAGGGRAAPLLGERPSLVEDYADMVSADRELRLAGYEVYRFGANELVGEGAEATDRRFLREALSPASRQTLSQKKKAAITRRRRRDHRPLPDQG